VRVSTRSLFILSSPSTFFLYHNLGSPFSSTRIYRYTHTLLIFSSILGGHFLAGFCILTGTGRLLDLVYCFFFHFCLVMYIIWAYLSCFMLAGDINGHIFHIFCGLMKNETVSFITDYTRSFFFFCLIFTSTCIYLQPFIIFDYLYILAIFCHSLYLFFILLLYGLDFFEVCFPVFATFLIPSLKLFDSNGKKEQGKHGLCAISLRFMTIYLKPSCKIQVLVAPLGCSFGERSTVRRVLA